MQVDTNTIQSFFGSYQPYVLPIFSKTDWECLHWNPDLSNSLLDNDLLETARSIIGNATVDELLATGLDPKDLCFLINNDVVVLTKKPHYKKSEQSWLVLSPHSDDAALSIGGLISRFSHESDITVLTLIGPSRCAGTCDPLYGNTKIVTEIRKEEDKLYGMIASVSINTADIEDVELYVDDAGKRWADHIMDRPDQHRINLFQCAIEKYLTKNGMPDKIFLPLAVGAHGDHAATHIAFENLRTKSSIFSSKPQIFYYEDLPYSAFEPMCLQRRLSEIKSISPVNVEINFAEKMHGISIYRSQYLLSEIDPVLRDYQHKNDRLNRVAIERLWKVS
jgi:LmbE family N-acetylglucosaminyl deacetylase